MATTRNTSARRREVRRTMPRPGPAWLSFLRRREVGWSALYVALLTLVGGTIITTLGQEPRDYLGQVLTRAAVPRVAFRHEDRKMTEEAREDAMARQPAVYRVNVPYLTALQKRIESLPALADFERLDQLPPDMQEVFTQASLDELRAYFRQPGPNGQSPGERWARDTQEFLRRLFDVAILRPERYALQEREPNPGQIEVEQPLRDPGNRQEIYASAFYNLDNHDLVFDRIRSTADVFPGHLSDTVARVVMLSPAPTYLYDEVATEEARRLAADAVPPQEKDYPADKVLVPAGQHLEEAQVELMLREREAYWESLPLYARSLIRLSHYGLALLVGLGLWGYIFAYSPRIVRNPMRGFALTVLFVVCHFLAVAMTNAWPEVPYATATFPTLLAVVVLAIAYDQRFALAVGAFHTLLVTLSMNLPIGFAFVLLAGVGVAVSQLKEVRTRSKLVTVGVWSGMAMGAATVFTALAAGPLQVEGELGRLLWNDALSALLAGVGVGFVVQGVLPGIERLFKVTTAMTLKELNDASHPLLQRLAQEAPGTYQHSLRIADMAESAAEAIGGNGLLCRVGAMYHDIGKINKPQYFIENQGGGPNRHSKLSPAMSLLIIVGHVKDGVEMAREYGLPQSIRHFIESHHGTTLVEYFYHAARKQKEAADEDLPSEFEFRYPGPKPQTKEAGILLLCDSLEAAARSLSEPTPIRIEQLVHNLASKRLTDGQFDECALTLQELHRIEQAITKTLNAIYHARIKYPGGDKAEKGDKDKDRPEDRPAADAAPDSAPRTPPRETPAPQSAAS